MDFSQLSFPGAPSIKVTPPGPESKKFLDHQSQHEGGAVSYPKGLPMAIRRAKGATVEDVDGNLYIDFFAGAGVVNVGHANPEVVQAARDQMEELTHALDFPNPSKRKLVDVLAELLPPGLGKMLFGGPTGSDAVESAIKLARFNTERHPIIAFEGSYHGMTSGALSVTSGRDFKEDFLPLVPEVHFVPYAYCYRCPFGKEPESCALECAQFLEHILDDPHSGVATPAAVIVEPVQGEGGSIAPPDAWLPMVREICDKYGVLLIADEIQAGLGRTGEMFSVNHTGTLPDIMVMSKGLGGLGFPISGIAYKEELDTWTAGKHIGTFRGNVVAYAAGAVALEFMVNQNLAGHARQVGDAMFAALKELEEDTDFVGEVRGKGLMLGVEFVKDKATKEPAPEFARAVRTACHQRGLLIEVGGHYHNVARFLPPLVVTQELADKGVEVFVDAVQAVEKTQ